MKDFPSLSHILAHAIRERDRWNALILAIQAWPSSEAAAMEYAPATVTVIPFLTGMPFPNEEPVVERAKPTSRFKATGLRAHIREVLMAAEGPMRGADVAKAVLARGYAYAGKTPFSTMVSTDLSQMGGPIRKVEGGWIMDRQS